MVDIFHLSQRQVAAVLTVLAFIPALVPLGLPTSITSYTQDFYNEVENLEPGDVVVFAFETVGYFTHRTICRALFYHIAEQGAKMVMYCFYPTTPVNLELILEYANLEDTYGYVYGQDYVVMPFLSGEETALAATGADMGVTGNDLYGTPVEDIPLMQNLPNGPHSDLSVAALAWNYGGGTWPEFWLRQWLLPYNVRGIDGKTYASIAPWYGEHVFGATIQTAGWAEYEKLTGFFGANSLVVEVQSLIGTGMIAFVVIGMIGWAMRRQKQVQREARV